MSLLALNGLRISEALGADIAALGNERGLSPPILDRMDRLHGISGTLIHGRLDVSGPAIVAWRLHHAWPGSELIIHEDEGHGGEAMVESWCRANTRHADRVAAERA